MKTKNIGKVIVFLLLTFLLIKTSSALRACQCSTINLEFEFTNNDNVVHYYNIQKSGSASNWAIVTPMSFELQPGESKTIVAFIKVKCDTLEGDYSLTLKAVSNGDTITKNKVISISSCHSVKIMPLKSNYNGCINDDISIPFNISNNGDFVEVINISSNGKLNIHSLILNPQDYQIINLIYKPTNLGVNLALVNISYKKGKAMAQTNINSMECAYFNASLSDNYVNLCENKEKNITLTIQNWDKLNTFFINSSDYFIDAPRELTLLPNEIRKIKINVYSGCKSGIINSPILISAIGAKSVELPLTLNLKDCYMPLLVSHKTFDKACSCDNLSYSFTLYNPGNRTITYSLFSNKGNIYVNNNKVNELTLYPDASVNLTLKYDIPCSFSGNLLLNLSAVSVNVCKKTSTAGINVNVSSWAGCEAVKLLAPQFSSINDSLLVVPVNIVNVGIKPASYRLVVSGTAMQNLVGISKSFITLNPGERDVVELTFDSSNITGSFVNIQAFSLDNLASDSVIVNFNKYVLSKSDIYYLLIPISILVLIIGFVIRNKFFNKNSISKTDEKK